MGKVQSSHSQAGAVSRSARCWLAALRFGLFTPSWTAEGGVTRARRAPCPLRSLSSAGSRTPVVLPGCALPSLQLLRCTGSGGALSAALMALTPTQWA
jgi:hypothetical protein